MTSHFNICRDKTTDLDHQPLDADRLPRRVRLPDGVGLIRHSFMPPDQPQRHFGVLPPGLRVGVLLSGAMDMIADGRKAPVTLTAPLAYLFICDAECPTRYVLHPNVRLDYVSVQFDTQETAGLDIPVLESLCRWNAGVRYAIRPAESALCSIARQVLALPALGVKSGLHEVGKTLGFAALAMDAFRCAEPPGDTAALSAADVQRLNTAREILLARMQDPPTLTGLARESGLNVRKLTRGFRTLYGHSPFAYLKRRRLERAYHLLSTGDLNVSQVAFSVGYTLPHFCNVFQERYGYPPGRIKRVQSV